MKRIVFSSLAILGIFLATGAMASNHPGTCANYRDRCKISGKADVCEGMYQYAITHNGAWNGSVPGSGAHDPKPPFADAAVVTAVSGDL